MTRWFYVYEIHGPLSRYVKLRVVHAPGRPGKFSPPLTSKETPSKRSRHTSRHVRGARAVVHVGIANTWCRGKRSQHFRRMRNPQSYISGKRPIVWLPKLLYRWSLTMRGVTCQMRLSKQLMTHHKISPIFWYHQRVEIWQRMYANNLHFQSVSFHGYTCQSGVGGEGWSLPKCICILKPSSLLN